MLSSALRALAVLPVPPSTTATAPAISAGHALLQEWLARGLSSESQLTPSISEHSSKHSTSYIPWTPSSQLQKRKIYKKRMHYLIQTLEEENVQKLMSQRSYPAFKAGDVLEVKMVVPEAQRKEYILKGVCIAKYNKSYRTTFKIYNVYPDVGGVVQHFPLYMPDIQEIKVVGSVFSNKHKLYHLLKKESLSHSYQSDVQLAS